MSNSALEIILTDSVDVLPEGIVKFNETVLSPPAIVYNTESGMVTFKEPGEYSIKWWVATETTLKGGIGFQLVSSKRLLASGRSPTKTGQLTGFGVIDVEETQTTLKLVNMSIDNTVVLSKRVGPKAYMLITPIGSSSPRVYRGDLSAAGSYIEVPLGNGIIYRLENSTSIRLRLALVPLDGPVVYDYRRVSAFDGGGAVEGNYSDGATLTARAVRDPDIYNNSMEMHWVMLRVQNPATLLWSTYEVRFFASGGISRVTVWVNVIEEEVSYS